MSKKPTYEQLKKRVDELEKEYQELQREKETFNEIHEKYTTLFERNLHCIYIHDFEGGFIDANDTALQLMGYDRQDISTLNLSSLIDEDQLPKAFATIKEIIQSGSQTQLTEYKVKKKDGNYVWIETDSGLIFREGKPYAIQGVARDITHRKSTAAALAESEKNYRELVQSVNSIIIRLDTNGNVKFINDFGQKFFGYSENEILGRDVIGSIVPATESSGRDLEAVIRDLGQHPERYMNAENENVLSNGERVWTAWTNRGVHDEKGNISEIICVGNNITERKKTEQALIEQETQFRTAIESLPFDFFAIDANGRYVMQNATCMKHWGDVVDKRPEDLGLEKETLTLWESNNQRAFEGETVEGEVTLRPHGKEGFYHNIISPIYDGDRIRGILGVNIDITERRKAEDALRESEAKFRALAESAPAAILIVTGQKIIYVNPAFELISGFTKEESLAMSFWEVVHPDMQEVVKRGMDRQRGENVPDRYELKASTKDGQTRWIDLTATSINYGDETATLAIAYDITDRKLSEGALFAREQELVEKTQDLEEMNAALRVLLKKRDEDKVELQEKIMTNLQLLVEPYLQNLKQTNLSDRQDNILDIVETNLNEIVSPFARNFASLKYKLTPKEIRVANLIKQGKTSKEIAEIMSVSLRTVEFHRTKIRNKFGLKDGKDNLRSLLISLN